MGVRETFKSIKRADLKIIKQSENLQYLSDDVLWSVYHTSPLKRLSFAKSAFRKYETLFSKKLPDCQVTFATLNGQPFSDSLLIDVSKSGKDVYSSLFLSVSADEESDDTISLPILLVRRRSKKEIVFKIHRIVENTFQCRIRPMMLSECQTYWMMGISLKESLRNTKSFMKITCKLPIPIPVSAEMYLTDDALSTMWNSLDNFEDDVLHIQTVDAFFNAINSHFKTAYDIDLSTSPITSFALKDLNLHFLDQLYLSVRKPETAFMLLSYLVADCVGD